MPNRYICDVLEEMRESFETYNFAAMKSLIEECQTLANRMEASLYDRNDIRDFAKELRTLKQEKRDLEFDIQEKKWQLEDLTYQIKVEKSKKKQKERTKEDGSLLSQDQ